MRFLERRPGRAAGQKRVVVADDAGRPAAHGLWFAGNPAAGLRPWADLVVTEPAVLPEVARELGPGASVMVGYEADDTERALRRRVPPVATPLGLALLRAGCRWFKDWYFPEGGREGGTKLQGTLPVNQDRRRHAEGELAAELRAFLERDDAQETDAARAREALALLEAGPGPQGRST
jgi:hypothetical protein